MVIDPFRGGKPDVLVAQVCPDPAQTWLPIDRKVECARSEAVKDGSLNSTNTYSLCSAAGRRLKIFHRYRYVAAALVDTVLPKERLGLINGRLQGCI